MHGTFICSGLFPSGSSQQLQDGMINRSRSRLRSHKHASRCHHPPGGFTTSLMQISQPADFVRAWPQITVRLHEGGHGIRPWAQHAKANYSSKPEVQQTSYRY